MTGNTKNPVYLDGEDDLEQISRMSKMDKADLSQSLRAENEANLKAFEQQANEETQRKKAEKLAKQEAAKAKSIVAT